MFPWAPARTAAPAIVRVDDRQINTSYHPGWCYFSVAVVDAIEFYRGHTHTHTRSVTGSLTHSRDHTCWQTAKTTKKTFHDIIGLIRSRPKWGRGRAAGLLKAQWCCKMLLCCFTAASFSLFLPVCLWVCLSRGSLYWCQGFRARLLPITLLHLVENNSELCSSDSASINVWKCSINLQNGTQLQVQALEPVCTVTSKRSSWIKTTCWT